MIIHIFIDLFVGSKNTAASCLFLEESLILLEDGTTHDIQSADDTNSLIAVTVIS